MCGRYAVTLPPEAMRQLFQARFEGPDWEPRYNVAPSQAIPIVRQAPDGAREIALVRWGLHPAWLKEPPGAKSMINARAETAPSKPFFRDAFKKRRCLIPMDGYYEWKRDGAAKTPHFIHAKAGGPIVCAGLWERWGQTPDAAVETAAILTVGANAALAAIHDRSPVILPQAAWAAWLDPKTPREPLEWVMAPAPDDLLAAYPVSRAVNAPANQGPGLIEPA